MPAPRLASRRKYTKVDGLFRHNMYGRMHSLWWGSSPAGKMGDGYNWPRESMNGFPMLGFVHGWLDDVDMLQGTSCEDEPIAGAEECTR